MANLVFYAVDPNHYIIWTGTNHQGSFIWALYPMDESHTRLVSRIRWSFHWTKPRLLALDLFMEFTDFPDVRENLQGVKGRVEGQMEPIAKQNTEFAFYVVVVLAFTVTLFFIAHSPAYLEELADRISRRGGLACHLVRAGIDMDRSWADISCSLQSMYPTKLLREKEIVEDWVDFGRGDGQWDRCLVQSITP